MLILSWTFKDRESELKCYDLLGMVYYLNNNLESAQILHEKSIMDYYEDDNSDIKK